MLMKIKNKMSLGFENLIKSADKATGIPDYIEVTPPEAYDLLRELNRVPKARESFTFEQDEGDHDIKLRLFGEMPDGDALNEIANIWFKRGLGVKYKDIPIYIVLQPKDPPPKKERNRRFVRKMKMRGE